MNSVNVLLSKTLNSNLIILFKPKDKHLVIIITSRYVRSFIGFYHCCHLEQYIHFYCIYSFWRHLWPHLGPAEGVGGSPLLQCHDRISMSYSQIFRWLLVKPWCVALSPFIQTVFVEVDEQNGTQ